MTKSSHDQARLAGPWILYDGTCSVCLGGVARFGPMLKRRGFGFAALQSDLAREFVKDSIDEMKLVTRDARVLGGVDAFLYIFRAVWWLLPLLFLGRIPPFHWLFVRFYRWFAAHRYCFGGQCRRPGPPPGRLS